MKAEWYLLRKVDGVWIKTHPYAQSRGTVDNNYDLFSKILPRVIFKIVHYKDLGEFL